MYLVLLGPPGSGKGTQGNILAQRLGIPKIATGDLLRAAARDGTRLGKQAERYMTRGLLVPDSVILGLIEEVLASPDAATGVIMDGFPRTIAQAEAVDRLLRNRHAQVDGALLFDVPRDELVKRMIGRGRKEGRRDDTREAIEKRLIVYQQETEPLISYFRDRGVLREIEGAGTIECVAERVKEAIAA